jgi:hemin uptake protein HemP
MTGPEDDDASADDANLPTSGPPEPPAAVLDARTLFGDRREVWIEHDGVRYRLRITRRGRLILQK